MRDDAPVHWKAAAKHAAGVGIARHPKVRAAPGETRRHDADESTPHAVQVERLADKIPIASELVHPRVISKDEYRRSTRRVVPRLQAAPQKWRHAKELESSGSNEVGREKEIVASRLPDHVDFGIRDESVKHMILLFVVAKFGITEDAAPAVLPLIQVAYAQCNQPVLILVGKWRNQGVINDAEDRRGSPDAQRQSENRNRGEAPIFQEAAKRKTKIVGQDIEMMDPSGVPAFFLKLFQVSKFEAGLAPRLILRYSVGGEFRYSFFDVKTQFGIQFLFRRGFPKQARQPAHEFPPTSIDDALGEKFLFRQAENQPDRIRQPLPIANFQFELLSSAARQAVEPGLATRGGVFPFGLHPSFFLQAVQRGIKRALLQLKEIAGDLLNALGDGIAVNRPGGDHL